MRALPVGPGVAHTCSKGRSLIQLDFPILLAYSSMGFFRSSTEFNVIGRFNRPIQKMVTSKTGLADQVGQ